MILTRKIQIYLTKEAEDKLWQVSYLCKELWNAAIEQRRDRKSWGKVNLFAISSPRNIPNLVPALSTPKKGIFGWLMVPNLPIGLLYLSLQAFRKRPGP